MKRFPRVIALVLLLLITAAAPYAEELIAGAGRYYLDLPEGWRPMAGLEGAVQSYSDPSETGILQIFSFKAGHHGTIEEFFNTISTSLGAHSEGAPFLFSDRPAMLADLIFQAGSEQVRGYGLFVTGREIDYALLAFSPQSLYETHHDFLLSALDSFAYDHDERLLPGPISQFYHPYPADRTESKAVEIGGQTVTLALDREESGATQVLIEREARILAADEVLSIDAWNRYYRVIYRDNMARFASFAGELSRALAGHEPRRQAEMILEWVQGFHYYRTGTLSDLTSPLACLATTAGDCDSRALLYAMLLHHIGIDAVLLVSTEYQHSAVAVDVDGEGARMPIDGKGLVFAEVTDDVALGLVARSMADPAGWIPIPLGVMSASSIPAR